MKSRFYFLPFAGLFCLAVGSGQVMPGRYIVELAGDPAVAAKSVRREAVRQEQGRVRSRIQRADTVVTGGVDTLANALFVRMSAERAAEVASVPGVRKVHPEKLYKLSLDHALNLQRVTDAWTLVGGTGNAGAGVKIGIIDTGIDVTHPAFQDRSLPVLDGFPRINKDTDIRYTNNKVIVARSYDDTSVFGSPADDRKGHGTAVAMIAAGVTTPGLLATITGVAPKAYLGSYKVFPNSLEGAPTSAIMMALEDAVADGMDVLNLSLGSEPADRPEEDFLVSAVERVAAAGVVVVIAAGNEGPYLHSIASPGTSPSAITVGSSWNERVFGSRVTVERADRDFAALPGGGPNQTSPASARLVDVSSLDENGLACSGLPGDSLRGKIAFILRGTCTFEVKLNNAMNAGAGAALVYSTAADPAAITMGVGQARLPGAMVSNGDGLEIKRLLAANPESRGTLHFDKTAFPVNSAQIAGSSSRGPSPGDSIKPDLLGVGNSIYTASPVALGSYTTASGTSLSAPMVAGAAAVLKSARPGLTARQYGSLLINSASTFSTDAVNAAPVMLGGTGLLNLYSALKSTVTAIPSSLGFGIGSSTVGGSQAVRLTNIGSAADTFSLGAIPIGDGPVAAVSETSIRLAAGESKEITVRIQGTRLTPGQYQGFVTVRAALTDIETRVPYWYGVPSNVAKEITLFDPPTSGRRLSEQYILFRSVDAAGIPTTSDPEITPVAGEGSVIGTESLDGITPGVYIALVRLGPASGSNVFEIKVGDKVVSLSISGQ